MDIKHTLNKWFAGTTFLAYYESTENATNTNKELEVQRSVISKWDLLDPVQKNQLADSIANIILMAIVRWKDMTIKPWELLGEDTKSYLRQAICSGVKKITTNREIYEKTNVSNINLGAIQINVDATNWMNAQDAIGWEAKNAVELSKIDDYEWYTEDQLVILKETGIIQTIAKADLSQVPDIAELMGVN